MKLVLLLIGAFIVSSLAGIWWLIPAAVIMSGIKVLCTTNE